MSEGEEKFEKTDSGASDSYPLACGSVKKAHIWYSREDHAK